MTLKEKKRTGSIRLQFSLAFIAVMAAMIVLCLIANSLLLRPYYMAKKTDAVRNAYRSINAASARGEIFSDAFDVELARIGAVYDIELIILNADSKTVISSSNDSERLAKLLWDNLLSVKSNDFTVSIIEKTDNYTLQTVYNLRTQTQNLVCWGYLSDNNMFLIESAVDSIDESAALSNRFMTVVGLLAIVAGALIMYFITGRMTKPITDLSHVSEKMSELTFDAKYEGHAGNELDLLGENLNNLSAALEQNISALKTANNELQRDIARREEVDAERREFISNVAHELKTPIALIQGYAEGLQEGVNDDEASRNEYCSVIVDESARMNRMVKRLITLSHLESGENDVNFERFDIAEMVQNYLHSAQILIDKAGANVRMEHYPPMFVWADEFLAEEVLQNYVSNALQHLGGEHVLEIRLTKGEGVVRVSVFNTGEQIPEEHVTHIWEKFYKVDKARTRAYGGSGIGLSIVRAVMEAMHRDYGVINYENGVEFWFELESV